MTNGWRCVKKKGLELLGLGAGAHDPCPDAEFFLKKSI